MQINLENVDNIASDKRNLSTSQQQYVQTQCTGSDMRTDEPLLTTHSHVCSISNKNLDFPVTTTHTDIAI